MLLFTGALLLPFTQTFIGQRLTSALSERFETNVSIHNIKVSPFGFAILKDILAVDHKSDTLIYVGYARTNVLEINKIIQGDNNLGDVILRNVDINVVTYKGEDTSNMNTFFKKFESPSTPKKSAARVYISSVSLTDVNVHIENQNKPQRKNLRFTDIAAVLKNFKIEQDIIQSDIISLETKTNVGDRYFTSVSGAYALSPTQMLLSNATIKTPLSTMDISVALNYPKDGLKSFVDSVQFDVQVKEGIFGASELNDIIPGWPMTASSFRGSVFGTFQDFSFINTSLDFDKTQIDFSFQTKDLFDEKKRKLIGAFSLNSSDLSEVIDGSSFLKERNFFDALGLLQGKCDVELDKNKLLLDLQMETSLGAIDIKASYDNSVKKPSYTAKLYSESFDVGALTRIPTLGNSGLNLALSGKGIDINKVAAEASGELINFEYRDYVYDRVNLEGSLTSEKFDGKMIIEDNALDLDLLGQLDFASEIRNFSFTTNINKADFSALGWVPSTAKGVFSGSVDLALQGNSIDELIGDLYIDKGKLTTPNNTYSFSSLAAQSRLSNNIRLINLSSEDIATGLLFGTFNPSELLPLLQNAIGSQFKNFIPHPISPNQYVDFNFNIRSKIASAIFGEMLSLDDNTFIKGKVNPDKKLFKLTIKSPNLRAFKTEFNTVELQIDTQNPLYHSFVSVDGLKNERVSLEQLNWINSKVNDKLYGHLEFISSAKLQQLNQFNTSFTIDDKEQAVLEIQNADFYFNDKRWFIDTNDSLPTLIAKNTKEFTLSDFVIKTDDSSISANAKQNGENSFSLDLIFEKVALNDFLSNEKNKWEGVIDGFMNLQQSSMQYGGNSSLKVENLILNNASLGDAYLTLRSQEDQSDYQLAFRIEEEEEDVVAAHGTIGFKNFKPELNITANFINYNLSVLEGLTDEVLNPFKGLANGTIDINTTAGNFYPSGTLYVDQLTLGVPYLNTTYLFDKTIPFVFEKDQIRIHDAGFTSGINEFGMLNGVLQHQSFSNWGLDMQIDAENLEVINTSFSEDALYYGKAFFNGNAHLHGSFASMQIDVLGKTASGTNLYIPLQYDTAIGDVSYINFVEKQPNTIQTPIELAKVKGLQMNFDLEVTADAEVEIVVDPETKSSLRGKGVGNLLLEIDTAGSFAMWGDFIALEGLYNFKNFGVIDKTFNLLPGGTIVWEGDPLGAQLNMQAVYEVPGGANPAILLEGDNISQKIPTDVKINLFGNLLNPETPTFEIDFPNTSGVVKNELNYRLNDQERRQLQAISLLTQGSFINEVSLAAISSQTLTNNLFQKASGVFDNIFTNENDRLNLSLNYLQGDRNAAASIKNRDRLGVSLSTNINERILIDGKVGIPVESEEETTIVGDVKVEFLLNKQGTLRARVFNKENEFQYFGDELGYTQGLGISYLVRFDSFEALVQKIFNKKK